MLHLHLIEEKEKTPNQNLIIFLNDCFILLITDNNYIIDKVTDNQISIFYNYNKKMIDTG